MQKQLIYTIVLIILLVSIAPLSALAQCTGGDNTTQPTIMVVPYVPNSGGDIEAAIENNSHYREIIIAVDDQFKSQGFNTKNFLQHLQNIRREEGINRYSDSQAEIDAVIARAGPDIWVKTEIIIAEMAGNANAKSLKLTCQAIHRVAAENLSSKIFDADRYNYDTDFGGRTRKEMEKEDRFKSFLEDMNESFQQIRDQGIGFSFSIVCYEDAEVRLDLEIGDDFDELSDFISEYVRKQAYKSSPQSNISTSTKLAWNDLKAPLMIKDDGDCVNYNIKKHFINPLRKKIRKEWAPQTELGEIYPSLKNDGIGKWILTLCDSKDDCPRE